MFWYGDMDRKKKRDLAAEREKARLLNPEKSELNRKKKRRRGILITMCAVLSLAMALGVGFLLLREIGRSSLVSNASSERPELSGLQLSEPIPEEEQETWQEGWVKYQGKTYAYNEDILTFLIMGIDKDTEAVEVGEGTDGGQADALFLVALNPHTSVVEIIGINRNAMTDIDVYDSMGNFVKTVRGQIATQHGFGDGVGESCAYQVGAVTKLMYGLPIHGYAAINMGAIATLNDAVGGVDVEVLEDLTKVDQALTKGAQVHLEGQEAFWYVKYRDVTEFGSADMRLARQKQYLTGLIQAAKATAKEDPAIVLRLYQELAPMMATDVTADEAAYLATQALGYRVGGDSFHMLEGETVMGDRYEEFYVDEEALYRLIIEVFYEEVK